MEAQEVFYDEVGREIRGTPQAIATCNACGHQFPASDAAERYALTGEGHTFMPDGPVNAWDMALAQWSEHRANGCEVRTVGPTGAVTIRKPYPSGRAR
jgi:hypothetical protein